MIKKALLYWSFTILALTSDVCHARIIRTSKEDIQKNKSEKEQSLTDRKIRKESEQFGSPEITQLQRTLSQQIAAINEQAAQAAEQLRLEVQEQTAIIQTKAHLEELENRKRELELKQAQLQQDLQQKGVRIHSTARSSTTAPLFVNQISASQIPASDKELVTKDWRLTQTAKFDEMSQTMKNTINEGETDEQERQDILGLLETQKQWFDKTMTQTTFVGDKHYQSLTEKTDKLAAVTSIFGQAEKHLKDKLDLNKVSKKYYDSARTKLLYEINARYHDNLGWNGQTPTLEQVLDAVNSALDQAEQTDEVTQSKPTQLEEKFNQAEHLLEEKTGKTFELEVELERNTNALRQKTEEATKAQTAADIAQAAKDALEKQLKDMEKGQKETQAKLDQALQAQTALDQLKTQYQATLTEKTALETQKSQLSSDLEQARSKQHEQEQKVQQSLDAQKEIKSQLTKATEMDTEDQKKIDDLKSQNKQLADTKRKLIEEEEERERREINLRINRMRMKDQKRQNKEEAKVTKEIVKAGDTPLKKIDTSEKPPIAKFIEQQTKPTVTPQAAQTSPTGKVELMPQSTGPSNTDAAPMPNYEDFDEEEMSMDDIMAMINQDNENMTPEERKKNAENAKALADAMEMFAHAMKTQQAH